MTEPDPLPPTAAEVVASIPVVDGRFDAAAVVELVPAAVLDEGDSSWPTLIDRTELIPTLWVALQEALERIALLEGDAGE